MILRMNDSTQSHVCQRQLLLISMLFVTLLFPACTDYEADYESMYGYMATANVDASIDNPSNPDIIVDENPNSTPDQQQPSSSNSKPNWNYLNPSVIYNEFTDPRDNQVYKVVTIGSQTWFVENLNYKVRLSYCYENKVSNCSKYGRLYEFSAALGACPKGWHMPNNDEWSTLWNFVGGTNYAGSYLKASSIWSSLGNALDAYGFALLPAGFRFDYGDFYDVEYSVRLWSSSEIGSDKVYYWRASDNANDVASDWSSVSFAYSVRCLKN